MKKKLLLGILSVATAACMAFGLAGCRENNDEDKDDTEKIDYTVGLDFEETRTDKGEKAYLVRGISFGSDLDIVIPSTYNNCPVIGIMYSAFHNNTSIRSVIIPDSVTSIGEDAFAFCSGLTSITIPNSVTEIGEGAFAYCSSLMSITIGNRVTELGDWAFEKCSSLTSITIPDSVTEIGVSAFRDCSGLTSVTIGNGVTEIGKSAFAGCTGLTQITFKGTTEQWKNIEKSEDWDVDTGDYTVHCTDGELKVG